ncbi:manganese catalase family protein [Bacillus mojavensis]|uniref:manganese catalase family protein n=1 Tax=Bacillus mojavensis TaxID=72360 RepID=UPI00256EE947|nr:manganese catalase family protein [Bacillus mojavensis]
MFKRSNRLRIDLPTPEHPDPNAADAVQELLGGKFGCPLSIITCSNPGNFRCKKKLKPFYDDLVSSITAEGLCL